MLALRGEEGLSGLAPVEPCARAAATELARAALLGEDARAVVGLWERMAKIRVPGKEQAHVGSALAALDIALWDLKAKAAGEPLWRALGGAGQPVTAYLSVPPPMDNGPRAEGGNGLRFEDHVAGHGFRFGKFGASFDEEADLRGLARAASALGLVPAEAGLILDGDGQFSSMEAVRRIRAIEKDFRLARVEAPVARDDFAGLRRVSDAIDAPVSAGDRFFTRDEWRPFLFHHALDLVQIRVAYTGVTQALQIADAACACELPVVFSGGCGLIEAHVAQAIPGSWMAQANPAELRSLAADAECVEGVIRAGRGAGVGWACRAADAAPGTTA